MVLRGTFEIVQGFINPNSKLIFAIHPITFKEHERDTHQSHHVHEITIPIDYLSRRPGSKISLPTTYIKNTTVPHLHRQHHIYTSPIPHQTHTTQHNTTPPPKTMGQSPSHPTPNTPLTIIGAGLPRTGTSSFTRALSTLLSAPIYHGGTQCTLGPEVEIKSWIDLLSAWPPKCKSDEDTVKRVLKARLDGYAGVTDAPCNGLVEELMEMYPDAVVICTVRDADAWVESMSVVANAATLRFLAFILYLVPTMRYFPAYVDGLRKQWVALYGRPEPATRHHWESHMLYLRRVVPPEKLYFYDVKEGWEPLCKILDKPVPRTAFPRINDSKAIDDLARKMVLKGLLRWAVWIGVCGLGFVVGWWIGRPGY